MPIGIGRILLIDLDMEVWASVAQEGKISLTSITICTAGASFAYFINAKKEY